MTASEGHNFQTGMYKYPSRFLWEINENLYVSQGILPQEIIDLAKKQIESENELMNPEPIPLLEVGDYVPFNVLGKGRVIEKDNEKNAYMIEFEKINGVRPIRFDWHGLKKLEYKDIIKKETIKIDSKETISEDFIAESNQQIENEHLKEDTFISTVINIFKIKK